MTQDGLTADGRSLTWGDSLSYLACERERAREGGRHSQTEGVTETETNSRACPSTMAIKLFTFKFRRQI